MATVTIHSDFGAQGNKICHCFHFPPFYVHEAMGLDDMILVFFHVEFQDSFFTLWKGDYPGWVSPNQVSPWTRQAAQSSLEKASCHVQKEGTTRQGPQSSLQSGERSWPRAAKETKAGHTTTREWTPPAISELGKGPWASDETAALADTLASAYSLQALSRRPS